MKTSYNIQLSQQKRKQRLAKAKPFIASLPKKIFKKTRQAEIVAERMKAIKELRDKFGLSFPQIGRIFQQHHATILHNYYKLGYYRLGSRKNEKGELQVISLLLPPEKINLGKNYKDYLNKIK